MNGAFEGAGLAIVVLFILLATIGLVIPVILTRWMLRSRERVALLIEIRNRLGMLEEIRNLLVETRNLLAKQSKRQENR